MSARKGKKKKRQSDGNRNDKTKQIKKTPKITKSKCLLATSSGSLQAASIPSFLLLLVGISEHSLAAAAAFHAQKHTHTHTLSLSLSLSLSKLESTTPWAPEKALEEYLYSGVISKVSWLGGQNSQFRHKRASNECGTGNENFTKRRNYKLTGTQTSFFHQFFLGGILSFLFPPERACTALLLLLLHIPLLLPVGLL